jgi:hypothetical protein
MAVRAPSEATTVDALGVTVTGTRHAVWSGGTRTAGESKVAPSVLVACGDRTNRLLHTK